MIIYHAHQVCHFLLAECPQCGLTPRGLVVVRCCKYIITMWVFVARSTVSGNVKTSMCGTSKDVPAFFISQYKCALAADSRPILRKQGMAKTS